MRERGRPTPLDEWREFADNVTVWYNEVFRILARSRNTGGFIPLSEILAFAREFDIIGSKMEFVDIITQMDSYFTEYQAKKAGK
jgi:hypothetical protein